MGDVRMIEFFSGIGGMRLAVEQSLTKLQPRRSLSCQAYDISLNANRTYQHNFLSDRVSTKLVEHLKAKDLDGEADIWTMSPPCQPFTKTRGAKGLDEDDKRCNGLKAIMKLLTEIEEKPKWIFLENVKGFATSRMVSKWKDTLSRNGYSWKEYLRSPIQIGIPNHRMRYFMLCEHSERWKSSNKSQEDPDIDDIPLVCLSPLTPSPVSKFVDKTLSKDDLAKFWVPESALEKKWASQLGIVSGGDIATHCFTGGYARVFHPSTGSLLFVQRDQNDEPYVDSLPISEVPFDRSDMLQYKNRLRRFTPRELLSIFGFPEGFTFPVDISLEHQYKLVGNSINVTLVSTLISELLEVNSSHADGRTLKVGGEKGHAEEHISGNLLKLYEAFRWKLIPRCTGRYTCREHNVVSSLSPIKLLSSAGLDYLDNTTTDAFKQHTLILPGRSDSVLVVPLDSTNETGLITFMKTDASSYVHTLNTPTGFRRKLEAIGIHVSDTEISAKAKT